MVRRYLITLACIALFGAAAAPAAKPVVVQSQSVALAGGSPWRVELTKSKVGQNASQAFYQWSLLVRDPSGRLVYDSAKNGVPFSRVNKANGAEMWFPVATGSIVGSGALMGKGMQQVVVFSHQMAADCGMARVDVLYYDASMKMVMPALSVQNLCRMTASVIQDARGTALAISGPYYDWKKGAAACCPTKNNVTSIFRFHNGAWKQTPQYFTIVPPR